MQRLIPTRHIFNLIGCLCNKPKLVLDEEKPLNEEDFDTTFYSIIYGAINNIVINNPNIEKITAVDVDNILASSPSAYKVFEVNNGFNVLSNAISNSNIDMFEQNYSIVKKFALLRDCVKQGLNIDHVFDYESIDLNKQAKQREAIETMSLDEILNNCLKKANSLEAKWTTSINKKSYTADFEIDDLVERLKSKKEMGFPYANSYYNALFNGMKTKKLVLRSMATGTGKSRFALLDLATVAAKERFDVLSNKWIENKNPLPASLISTELEIDELQSCLVAIISGVSENIVKNGTFTGELADRVERAIKIIKEANIQLHYIDDFNIQDIELIIKKDILENNVKHIWFDYIQVVPKLARTAQDSYGMALREDQILVSFASSLKLLANKYDCYISTSTQLNRGAKDENNRDASGLRGSSAVADKCDAGIMCFRASEKDLDKVKHILENDFYKKPNFTHWVFKNRGFRSGVIIWTNLDYSTMSEEACFMTTTDYELITDIQPLKMEFAEVKEVNNPFN